MRSFIGIPWAKVKKKLDSSYHVSHTDAFIRHVPNEGIWAEEWATLSGKHTEEEAPPLPIVEYIKRGGANALAVCIRDMVILIRDYRIFSNPKSGISGQIYEGTAANNALIDEARTTANALVGKFPANAIFIESRADVKMTDYRDFLRCLNNVVLAMGIESETPSACIKVTQLYPEYAAKATPITFDPPHEPAPNGFSLLYECLYGIANAWSVEECVYDTNSYGEDSARSNNIYHAMSNSGWSQTYSIVLRQQEYKPTTIVEP